MPIDLPDVYLELLCCNGAGPTKYGEYNPSVIAKESYVPLDPSKYDGSCLYWFEVVANNPLAKDIPISLIDTSGASYATITIPASEGAGTYDLFAHRVQFTPPATARTMTLLMYVSDYPTEQAVRYTCARIRIRQTGATKSRVQWPMLAFGGAFAQSGSQWDIGTSLQVRTGGAYRTGYSDYSSPLWATSLDCLPIWKFNATDLDPVSSVLFRALPGKHIPNFNAWMFQWEMILPGILTHVDTGLYYSDDGGVTKLPAYPGVTGGEHHLPVNLGDPYPWTFDSDIDPSLFNVPGRQWYAAINTLTSYIYTDIGLAITPGYNVIRARFIGYTGTHAGGIPNDTFYCGIEIECDDANIYGLSIAVFDRDTNAMVPGSELTWAVSENFDWKQTPIDPADLTDGHEYEVRLSSPAVTLARAPYICEAQLYLDVDPISIFTSWQRLMNGTMTTYFWDYVPGGGAVYSDSGIGCVAISSRLQYHEIPTAKCYYQECSSSLVVPSDGYNFDPLDPGIAYEYFSMWDDALNDSGVQAGSNRVDISMLNWVAGDFLSDHPRILRRTGEITPALVDDHRYCNLQPDDHQWLGPMDGYLVMTVQPPTVAECLSVSASIDSATLVVNGTGTGQNGSAWRVIRTSDSAVMDSGSGNSASFSFVGAYDTTYQLQFMDGQNWSTEGCTFLFPGNPSTSCNDLPCTTPLCVPVATVEQYQGSLTAVAGPTARIK